MQVNFLFHGRLGISIRCTILVKFIILARIEHICCLQSRSTHYSSHQQKHREYHPIFTALAPRPIQWYKDVIPYCVYLLKALLLPFKMVLGQNYQIQKIPYIKVKKGKWSQYLQFQLRNSKTSRWSCFYNYYYSSVCWVVLTPWIQKHYEMDTSHHCKYFVHTNQ